MVKQVQYFYVATVVGIVDRCCLSIDAFWGNHFNKHKLALYKLSIHFISNKTEHFSYKDGCGMIGIKVFKKELAWAPYINQF